MSAIYTPALPLLPPVACLPPLPRWHLPADAVDPSARVPYPPTAAELARRRPTPLWQAVLLALLLHVWAALLLGSVPPGSAEPGKGVGGVINIRLQGTGPFKPDADATPPLPAPPATGPAGDASRPRFGGAVRSEPAGQAEPGAMKLGNWAPQPARPLPAPPQPAAAQSAARQPALSALGPAPAAVAPGSPDLPATPRAPELAAPSTEAPPPLLPTPALAAGLAMAELPAQRQPMASLQPAGLPVAAPSAWPALPQLAEVPALPALAAAPAGSAAAPLAALNEGSLLSTGIAPPASLAPEALPALAAPDSRLGTPAQMTAPLSPRQAALPTTGATVTADVPAWPDLPKLSELGAVPSPVSVSDAAVTPSLAQSALAQSVAPQASHGAPEAGNQVGADIATAPSAPASAPRLNLQLPRTRGGELSRLGSAGLLAVMPRPPELKTQLEKDMAGLAIKDCRTAHAKMGLAAVVPLVADALKQEGGCRW